MKNNNIKNRIFWVIGAVVILILCLFICRYVTYTYHGNKQWPVVLFIFGFIVLCITAIFDGRKIMICTIAGYICGLALGTLLNSDVVIGPNGETGKTWWKIWTISFFAMIVMGIIWEIIGRAINKHRSKH